jgi:hypothetical protein
MGNQIDKGGEPKNNNNNKITSKKSENVNVNLSDANKKSNAKNENLFAEDKLFENYESIYIIKKNIFIIKIQKFMVTD